MSKKIRVLISDSFDPWFNLATEDYIFRDMDPSVSVLFLWRNDNTVVIGRFQNPWTECNVARLEADGVKLARRQSGGGAVYQDLGNTCFTFMNGQDSHSKERNNQIITNAINSFGLKSYASGRNDILVDDAEGPKKISGSAFKETKDRAFHHGTLLINANLGKLGDYLSPNKKKLASKGIKSVISRVTNLQSVNSEITHELLCERIISEFVREHEASCEIEHLRSEDLKQIPELNNYYEKLADWNWRYGETPKFKHQMDERFSFGHMEFHLDSHKGMIERAVIYSDSLHPEMIEELSSALVGVTYHPEGIAKAITQVKNSLPFIADYLSEVEDWLKIQVA